MDDLIKLLEAARGPLIGSDEDMVLEKIDRKADEQNLCTACIGGSALSGDHVEITLEWDPACRFLFLGVPFDLEGYMEPDRFACLEAANQHNCESKNLCTALLYRSEEMTMGMVRMMLGPIDVSDAARHVTIRLLRQSLLTILSEMAEASVGMHRALDRDSSRRN